MRIEVYVDDAQTPLTDFEPPESFSLNTLQLEDGPHVLTLKAIDKSGTTSVHETRFMVRNGPGIAIHGIRDNDTVEGEISILANAYSSRAGDIFQPSRIETPAPIPIWVWLILLSTLSWGMWYLGLTSRSQPFDNRLLAAETDRAAPEVTEVTTPDSDGEVLGAQVYGNRCAACHQANGEGLAGLFPSLVQNTSVTATDPDEQISTVLNGLQNKEINGFEYATPMPPFGDTLTDSEISAVVNYTRTSWGNASPLVTPGDVGRLRQD